METEYIMLLGVATILIGGLFAFFILFTTNSLLEGFVAFAIGMFSVHAGFVWMVIGIDKKH